MAEEYYPAVKGVPFTPGKGDYPNVVGLGRRQLNNTLDRFRDTGSSFWWNAAYDTKKAKDIYDLAEVALITSRTTTLGGSTFLSEADAVAHAAQYRKNSTTNFYSCHRSGKTYKKSWKYSVCSSKKEYE